jgi:hypothetical protein
VGKLLYKSKGPFVVKEVLGTGRCIVQRWNKENAPLLKCHGSDMYLLAPGLLPCDPLDTPDLRYLNGSHGIVTNPLEPNLGVTLFNEQWFDGHLPVYEPSNEHVSVEMRLDGPSPQWRDEDDSQDHDVPIEMAESGQDWNATTEDLYDNITASTDKLFFIGYINEQTFLPRWYLVRVAKEQQGTAPSAICSTYTVEFFAKHPRDDRLADPNSQWWPEWHE